LMAEKVAFFGTDLYARAVRTVKENIRSALAMAGFQLSRNKNLPPTLDLTQASLGPAGQPTDPRDHGDGLRLEARARLHMLVCLAMRIGPDVLECSVQSNAHAWFGLVGWKSLRCNPMCDYVRSNRLGS
jgi:hypothetical protein